MKILSEDNTLATAASYIMLDRGFDCFVGGVRYSCSGGDVIFVAIGR